MPRLRDSDAAPDPDLMAYVDGALPPEEMARIEAQILADTDLRARAETWRRHRDLIRQAAQQADTLPDNLRIVALQRELERRLKARQWRAMLIGPRLRQVAASVVIFAAGWAAHALLQGPDRMMAQSSYPRYVESSLSAHYAALRPSATEVRFDGHDIDAALDWMSEQMQMQIDSPRLDRLGYEVLSAQLETSGATPVAHFVYRNPQGETVTVSVAPHPVDAPAHSLRIARTGAQSLVYWSEGPYDYSVVAATDPGRLTTLAAAVRE